MTRREPNPPQQCMTHGVYRNVNGCPDCAQGRVDQILAAWRETTTTDPAGERAAATYRDALEAAVRHPDGQVDVPDWSVPVLVRHGLVDVPTLDGPPVITQTGRPEDTEVVEQVAAGGVPLGDGCAVLAQRGGCGRRLPGQRLDLLAAQGVAAAGGVAGVLRAGLGQEAPGRRGERDLPQVISVAYCW